MKYTENYNLNKPDAATDNVDIDILNENADTIDEILTPTIDQSVKPTGNSGKVGEILGWIANRLKTITGKSNWCDDPQTNLAVCTVHLNAKNNPHSVSKTQVGLGNVDNTSDADKPMSTPVRTEFGALSNLQTAAKNNLVAAINELKTGIEYGSYEGNDAASRKISLGFTPRIVILMGGDGGNPGTNAMYMHSNGIAMTGTPHQSTSTTGENVTRFSVTSGGFYVFYDADDYRGPNRSGNRYHYIAFM